MACHHAATLGSTGPRAIVLFKLVSLQGLLVLQLLFGVLIALEDLIVLHLTQLQPLIHLSLQLLSQGIHFDLLLLHKLGLVCEYLFMAVFHVLLTFSLFHIVGSLLNLVRLLIILLLCQVDLNLAEIEQLGREFKSER